MKFETNKVVIGCQRKESDAQRCLYEHFAPSMLGVCMRYTHSRDEAMDLLQDGFIKVFETIGTLRKPDAVGSWMRKIMVNLSVNYITRDRHVLVDSMEIPADEDTELDTDNYRIEDVMQAIQNLPDLYRMVFNMREVDEMEYDEIARELGLKENTLRSTVSRAKLLIRKYLANNNNE